MYGDSDSLDVVQMQLERGDFAPIFGDVGHEIPRFKGVKLLVKGG